MKPKQSRITLDTKMEITLSNDFWLVSVFYYGTQLALNFFDFELFLYSFDVTIGFEM